MQGAELDKLVLQVPIRQPRKFKVIFTITVTVWYINIIIDILVGCDGIFDHIIFNSSPCYILVCLQKISGSLKKETKPDSQRVCIEYIIVGAVQGPGLGVNQL